MNEDTSVYFSPFGPSWKLNDICQHFQFTLILFILMTQQVNIIKIILVYEELIALCCMTPSAAL